MAARDSRPNLRYLPRPPMTTFHIGCAGFARPRAQYVSRLHFVELDLRPPLPSPKLLAGWRKACPEGFVFAVVAPPALWGERDWPLRDEALTRSELDRMANNASAVAARVAVFRTPVAVAPGSAALKRFETVLERARKSSELVVWDPSGLWEREAAIAFAEPFGALVAADPLHDPVEDEAIVYARLRGLGNDRTYHTDRLEDLAETLTTCDEAFVVFESANAYQEALRLARVVGALPAAEEGEADEADDEEDDEEEEDGDADEEEDEG